MEKHLAGKRGKREEAPRFGIHYARVRVRRKLLSLSHEPLFLSQMRASMHDAHLSRY
jgi:hypothetical protein